MPTVYDEEGEEGQEEAEEEWKEEVSEEELQILLAGNTLEDGDEDYDVDADLEPYLEEVNRAQEALTVASQKLKNVTLGRGWTTSPKRSKGKGKGKSKSSSTSSQRKSKTPEEIAALKKKHPCAICKKLGHWANECDQNPNEGQAKPKTVHDAETVESPAPTSSSSSPTVAQFDNRAARSQHVRWDADAVDKSVRRVCR